MGRARKRATNVLFFTIFGVLSMIKVYSSNYCRKSYVTRLGWAFVGFSSTSKAVAALMYRIR